MIANPHQGQRTADIGSSNAQYVYFLENATAALSGILNHLVGLGACAGLNPL
jgi:hypothetical protein